MTVWNLGSINADFVYRVPHLPASGETLAAQSLTKGLGGKGANMSVAIARAGGHAVHMGAVGFDGAWAVDLLTEYGVDTRHIQTSKEPTAHAIISVDDDAENSIILFSGANADIQKSAVQSALAKAETGDYFVTQNETILQTDAAKIAKDMGLKVAYAAAPFSIKAVAEVLPYVNLLFLNEIEATQLIDGMAKSLDDLGVPEIVVTLGAKGCRYKNIETGKIATIDAIKVQPVDTTGAGDTFTGFTLAGLDRGMPMEQALNLANNAAALMATRMGTADVIPDLKDVRAFSSS